MEKRRIQTMFTALTAAAVFFTGCPTGHDDTGESGDPNSEDGKTYILFQNANPYAVDVYSDSSRVNKAATIPAGRESRLEWTPNPDGSSFYLTYQIPVGDDVLIPYNPPWIVTYRIDEGKITSIAIASLVSSPNLITDRVYLLLYNESGNEAFHLEQQGRIPIKPEKLFSGNESVPDSISLVNPSERAWYIISAGSAAAYSVSVGGAQKPFPEFQAGWFYTFRYRDGDLSLDTAQRLSLEELLSRISLQADLAWLDSNAEEGGVYTITLSADQTVSPQTLSYSGKTVSITLKGDSAKRTVSLSSPGSLFTVGSGVTLMLDNNVTLQGQSGNTSPLVRVNSGGTLVMNSGSKISGNTNSYIGGGVYIYSDGAFTMHGGEISGNTSSFGGGVYVNGGVFTMNSGTISGNTASSGGGVYVGSSSGTFTMSGGTISGNTAKTYFGGGVSVSDGTFTKSAGIIYGSNASAALKNTASRDSYGHAIYVFSGSNSGSKKRDSTAGEDVSLDSEVSGSAGGWE